MIKFIRILTIPIVVEPIVVPVQSAIVPIQVTNIQVVVRRVPKMYEVSSIPPLIEVNELSSSCIEFCILNTITPHTKYYFIKFLLSKKNPSCSLAQTRGKF